MRTLLRHPFIMNEKIDNPLSSEFYGVEMISNNFKNFFNKFTDNKEENKSILSDFEECEEEDSSQVHLSD